MTFVTHRYYYNTCNNTYWSRILVPTHVFCDKLESIMSWAVIWHNGLDIEKYCSNEKIVFFVFSCWNVFLPWLAEGKPSNENIETWKLKISRQIKCTWFFMYWHRKLVYSDRKLLHWLQKLLFSVSTCVQKLFQGQYINFWLFNWLKRVFTCPNKVWCVLKKNYINNFFSMQSQH